MAAYSPAGAGAIPFVEAKLKQKKVMLFTKNKCPESQKVMDILEKYQLHSDVYESVEIECRQDCTQIENYFFQLCLTNSRSVPRLFVARKYIGSTKEVTELDESGMLKRMLVVARALEHL